MAGVKLVPGMVLGGSPYGFLPGNCGVKETTKKGILNFSGSYNEGELPCATYVKYGGLLRELPGNETYLSTYECVEVYATSNGTLRSESDSVENCCIKVPDYHVLQCDPKLVSSAV